MKRYKIVGNYGTFTVSRLVVCETAAEAWERTGISVDLIQAGWSFDDGDPDGEEWEVYEGRVAANFTREWVLVEEPWESDPDIDLDEDE